MVTLVARFGGSLTRGLNEVDGPIEEIIFGYSREKNLVRFED